MKHSLDTIQTHTTSGRSGRCIGSHLYEPRGAQHCHRQFICLLGLSEVVWTSHGCQTSLPFHLERERILGGLTFTLLFIIRYPRSYPLMSDHDLLIRLKESDRAVSLLKSLLLHCYFSILSGEVQLLGLICFSL